MAIEVQRTFLIGSLSHVIEMFGLFQRTVLREHRLEAIHMSLLLRAGRHGAVSFDRIKRDTGEGISRISRAALALATRQPSLGSVKPFVDDRRRRRFHINDAGKALLAEIELQIARLILANIGVVSQDSRRYYEFTVHLWNLARFLPASRSALPEIYFPTEIPPSEKIPRDRLTFEIFARDLLQPAQLKLGPHCSVLD